MREIDEEEFSQQSFSALFATIAFALMIALVVLYFYARDVIQENHNDRMVVEHQLGKVTGEFKQLLRENGVLKQEFEMLKKMKLLTADERDMSGRLSMCKAENKTLVAIGERHKAELKTYEAIQVKSNEYIQMLLLKLGEKKIPKP